MVNWGDGSPSSPATVSYPTYTFTGSHTYAVAGSYNVTVSVTDGASLSSTSAPVGVTVADVAPTVGTPIVSPTSGILKGVSTPFTVNGTFNDPAGALETYTGHRQLGVIPPPASSPSPAARRFLQRKPHLCHGRQLQRHRFHLRQQGRHGPEHGSQCQCHRRAHRGHSHRDQHRRHFHLGRHCGERWHSTVTARGVVYSTVSDANNPKLGGGQHHHPDRCRHHGRLHRECHRAHAEHAVLLCRLRHQHGRHHLQHARLHLHHAERCLRLGHFFHRGRSSGGLGYGRAFGHSAVRHLDRIDGHPMAAHQCQWHRQRRIVPFTFDANGGVTRSGTINISGQTFTVTQAEAPMGPPIR